MACCRFLVAILLLVLPWTYPSIRGVSGFRNHTSSAAGTSTSTSKESTSASSAAALQYNETMANDTHTVQSSLQSGSGSSMATITSVKGNASSSSESTVHRNDQIVQGEDTWSGSIRHAISHSTTHVLTGRQEGLAADSYPEMPRAITLCEFPAKCLAGALSPTDSETLKTVVIADAADAPSEPQVPRKWQPPSSRFWVYCLDPDSCDQDYESPSYEDSDEYTDYEDRSASFRSFLETDQHGNQQRVPGFIIRGSDWNQKRVPGFIIRGSDLSRAIERRGLTGEYHNALQQLNRSAYYRWLNVPTKVLLAKMLALSKDERIGPEIKFLLQKLSDHIERMFTRKGMTHRTQRNGK